MPAEKVDGSLGPEEIVLIYTHKSFDIAYNGRQVRGAVWQYVGELHACCLGPLGLEVCLEVVGP